MQFNPSIWKGLAIFLSGCVAAGPPSAYLSHERTTETTQQLEYRLQMQETQARENTNKVSMLEQIAAANREKLASIDSTLKRILDLNERYKGIGYAQETPQAPQASKTPQTSQTLTAPWSN